MTTTQQTPATQAPLCDEAEFAELVEGLVADFAPRVFALVEEEGERVDGCVVAWGMAFEDRAEVVGVNWAFRGSFSCAGSARRLFSRHGKIRLVWYNPEAVTSLDQTT